MLAFKDRFNTECICFLNSKYVVLQNLLYHVSSMDP
jgi:hypothetical protein